MKKSKIPPLRTIALSSRPYNHRALAWSSDAELAVAADDSVTIYLPTFPLLDPTRPLSQDDDATTAATSTGPQLGDHVDLGNGMGILPANLPENNDDDNLDDDGNEDDADEDDDSSEGGSSEGGGRAADEDLLAQLRKEENSARQFGQDCTRVLCVAYPPLHPELNLHVWEAAGKAMPLIRSVAVATAAPVAVEESDAGDEVTVSATAVDCDGDGDGDGDEITAAAGVDGDGDEVMDDAESEGDGGDANGDGEGQDGEEEEQPKVDKRCGPRKPPPPPPPQFIAHPGAGTGVIAGSGSSLNHVVAVEWSPAGLGRNLRPVLAVLTGCGSLAVYGEGGFLPFGSTAKPSRVLDRGGRVVRELQSWLALWAVGENFVLPGQEEYGYGEFVKAFAWSERVGKGKALLGYMNDLREIVVLCVATTFQKTVEGVEEALWNVQEVARMVTAGPHEHVDPDDPDYIPSGSSYSLRWGPWVEGKKTWSCLLSYMDNNYIGFKKFTINAPAWRTNEAPILTYQAQDWDGICVHLSTDAFLEFENKIWDVKGKLACRGVVATPLLAKPFEIDLKKPAKVKAAHSTDLCKTTFPQQVVHNPITGLVVHPIPLDVTTPPATPLYTAVRLSATAINSNWWESNTARPTPQWVTEINAKITRLLPLGKAIHEGDRTAETAADGDDGIIPREGHDNDADDSDQETSHSDANFDPWAKEGPDVYPYNMRVWGLARSPGGGSTAVLATPLLTQRPMRGTWAAHRSRLLFGHEDVQRPREREEHQKDAEEAVDKNVAGLSTEARLWEWMHGGGSGVPGLTPPPLATSASSQTQAGTMDPRLTSATAQASLDAETAACRARVREIFAPFVAAQRCEICSPGSVLTPVQEEEEEEEEERKGDKNQDGSGGLVVDAECTGGHRVAVCGLTGLAILAPGISRACGVCRWRCLEIEWLLERVLHPAGRTEEAAWVSEEMERDVCGRCGGKFLD